MATEALAIRRGSYPTSTPDGPFTARGWVCGCIGWIALGRGWYGLTHLPTGMRIGEVRGKARTEQAARDLNPLFTAEGSFGQPPPPASYAGAQAYLTRLYAEQGTTDAARWAVVMSESTAPPVGEE